MCKKIDKIALKIYEVQIVSVISMSNSVNNKLQVPLRFPLIFIV